MNSRRLDYRVKIYGKNNRKVVFLFCPFGVRMWQFTLPFLPTNRMVKAGYQVVAIDFNIRVGRESPQKSLTVLSQVFKDVQDRVAAYKAQGITDFSVFGASMGTLFAAYSGAHIPEIKNVILNLPYGDIAGHIVNFPGMLMLPKNAIKKYIQTAGGEDKLAEMMKQYSPINLAKDLSKKRVMIYLARKDEVLQYENSVQLKNLLEANHTDLTYRENKTFGHYLSGSINHLRGEYIDFLLGN